MSCRVVMHAARTEPECPGAVWARWGPGIDAAMRAGS